MLVLLSLSWCITSVRVEHGMHYISSSRCHFWEYQHPAHAEVCWPQHMHFGLVRTCKAWTYITQIPLLGPDRVDGETPVSELQTTPKTPNMHTNHYSTADEKLCANTERAMAGQCADILLIVSAVGCQRHSFEASGRHISWSYSNNSLPTGASCNMV